MVKTNMKKTTTAIIAAAVLLVAGVGGFFIYKTLKAPIDSGNAVLKQDLIRATSPSPGDSISSPLVITGEARGFWFFEASFPVKVYDANNNLLGIAVAQAQGDWMTTDFVPFTATLEFSTSETKKGTLILEKDNPSGLLENEDSLIIPIYFKK
jgi:hypothetical protein